MLKKLCVQAALLLSFSLLMMNPSNIFAQSSPLTCTDIKNGTFNFLPLNSYSSVYVRNGETQRETTKGRRETIFWEVQWLNDCTYSLKYISGLELKPKAEQDLLKKHKIVCEILTVTEDYYVFRSALDKVSNKTLQQDTLWIKERKSAAGKSVSNPRADSIMVARKAIADSAKARTATIFVYRPGKFINALATYDIYFNDVAVATITNGVRLQIAVPEGNVKITAKETIRNTEVILTLDAKRGNQYYLKCEALHKLSWTLPKLTLMDEKVGKQEWNSE